MRNNSIQGFTLIELMIVVTIIGILFSMAFPIYSDYVARASHVAGFREINMGRPWMETHLNHGISVTSPADINLSTSTANCSAITATGVSATGVASVTCTLQGIGLIHNRVITLNRDSAGNWACESTADADHAGNQCTTS